MRVRRRRICFIQIADQLVPDFSALFSGELKLGHEPGAELLCPVSGETLRVNASDLAFIASLPSSEWTDVDSLFEEGRVEPDVLRDLLQRHVLLSDVEADQASQKVLEAEKRFEDVGWYDITAVYHAMTAWTGMADDVSSREHTPEAHRDRLGGIAEKHGPPPAHFPRREDAVSAHPLELPVFDSELAKLLVARRTTRAFRTESTLPLAELAYVLYGCFGAQGIRELAPGAVAVKRTSPSGGGLTPVDPYPLIMRVEGLDSGIYHYDMSRHSLELIRAVPEKELRDLALEVTAGQDYFVQAQAMVVHVGRFNRHHWKYRNHRKAYKALLMDSAHLSQTFYLLATERRLGAFYTAAINDVDLGSYLGLDPREAAAIGINGLGISGEESNTALHFNPEPYTPNADSA